MKKELKEFIKKTVVIDTQSSMIYVGVLEKVTDNCVVLSDVDVHDNTDTSTSKERYIFETKTTGIKSNRNLVYIKLDVVVSFSLLDDIKKF
ncbi:MAG: hypothetical protein GY699_06900 [Desulfobacteraceae bacterium]|nr:hypothetical protein [Desulfobacteraceae bacterium]